MKPGYYFNLPEDVHHSVAALSKSGIKKLLESPLSYSEAAPWKHDPTVVPSPAMLQGRARHCLFFEGSQSFERKFAREFSAGEHPNLCRTVEDMKSWIRSNGGTPKGTLKTALAEQARGLGATILDDVQSAHRAKHAGKTLLPAAMFDAILESHGYYKAIQTRIGVGHPEISVIWDDDELGCLCKARFDWLGISPSGTTRIVDLKDFSTQIGAMPLSRRIEKSFANFRYDIDAWFYTRALEQTPPVWQDNTALSNTWLENLSPGAPAIPEFMLLFHRVVGSVSEFAPRTVLLHDRSTLLLHDHHAPSRIGRIAERDCRAAALSYNHYMRTTGARVHPWIPEWKIQTINDSVARMFE